MGIIDSNALHTSDGGQHWTRFPNPFPLLNMGAISPIDQQRAWVEIGDLDEHHLFLVPYRTIITGDAFQTMSGVAVSGTLKPLFPMVSFATWHTGLALERARKLRALEPSRMAVGHGRLLPQPLAAMNRAIAQAARNVEQSEQREISIAHK